MISCISNTGPNCSGLRELRRERRNAVPLRTRPPCGRNPMNAITVSVIIPCRNSEKHIAACLRSVLGQSLRDIEIICIDDGSSDSTLRVIEKTAAEAELCLLTHESARGVFAARNTGLRAARGKYVFFLDSDDTLYDAMALQALFEEAEAAGSDLVTGRILRWFPATDERLPVPFFSTRKAAFSGTTVLQTPELAFNDRACGKLFRRTFLVENNVSFDESLALYAEMPFSCRLYMAAASISSIDKTVYISRQHETDERICVYENTSEAGEVLLSVVMDIFVMTRDTPGYASVYGLYLKKNITKSLSLFMAGCKTDSEKKSYFTLLHEIGNVFPSIYLPDSLLNAKERIDNFEYMDAYILIHDAINNTTINSVKEQILRLEYSSKIDKLKRKNQALQTEIENLGQQKCAGASRIAKLKQREKEVKKLQKDLRGLKKTITWKLAHPVCLAERAIGKILANLFTRKDT